MRIKNLHAASLMFGATEIEPGAEGDVDGSNPAVAAWLAAGLCKDVTPLAPPAEEKQSKGGKG